MAFSNEKIEKLKQDIQSTKGECTILGTREMCTIFPEDLEALLARLEAAETALMAQCDCEPVDHPDKCKETVAWNKWCKSKGDPG